MKVRFLLDENLSPRLKVALLRLNPIVDVVRVGDPDAPPLGTRDPDVLRYLETSQRLLVTSNLIERSASSTSPASPGCRTRHTGGIARARH